MVCRGPSSPYGLRRGSLRCERACRAEAGVNLLSGWGPPSPFGLRRGSLRCVRARRAEAGEASEGWWSQAGSNRRPRHCERRALPAELWPLRGRLELRRAASKRRHLQSAPRPSQERRNHGSAAAFDRNFPCLRGGEPIFTGRSNPRPSCEQAPPCVPFSTSF